MKEPDAVVKDQVLSGERVVSALEDRQLDGMWDDNQRGRTKPPVGGPWVEPSIKSFPNMKFSKLSGSDRAGGDQDELALSWEGHRSRMKTGTHKG